MPRPQTKQELIEASTTNYEKLMQLIESLTEKELNTPFDFSNDLKKTEAHWKRDKNLRDVVVHLHEWHKLLLNWIQNNQSGIRKPFLMEGYNWKTYGDMNVIFWRRCQDVSLDDAMEQFKSSHIEVMKVLDTIQEEELFKKGAYDWTGGTSLGSYFVSNTSSHYAWAIKKIKAHRKNVNG